MDSSTRFFTYDFFFHESTGFHGQKCAENCGSEALKLRTPKNIVIAELQLRSNISLKVAELRLRKCFLLVAELWLRTQKKVARAHLCCKRTWDTISVEYHNGLKSFFLRWTIGTEWRTFVHFRSCTRMTWGSGSSPLGALLQTESDTVLSHSGCSIFPQYSTWYTLPTLWFQNQCP